MQKVTAILSMLHERPGGDSAGRRFRGESVLHWTLRRLRLARRLEAIEVVCWDDQIEGVRAAINGGAEAVAIGRRQAIAPLEALSASRRWADGWRGGLGGTCEFDRGFHGPACLDIVRRAGTDGALLVDPAAGLVDPALIDGLLAHAAQKDDLDLCFSQAAPGLSGVVLSAGMLDKLAQGKSHPGMLLIYRPDTPRRDPIGEPACCPIPTPLARTGRRFVLDSQRQIDFLSRATAHLNGELISTGGMELLASVEAAEYVATLPREIVMELNVDRATNPIYAPGKRLNIQREPMTLDRAKAIFAQLKEVRLLLAGVGDPLLHEQIIEIIAAAKDAGIEAISLETDLLGAPIDRVAALAESGVDIVSVHLPAARAATYHAVMGVDGLNAVIANMRVFMDSRAAHARGVPLLTPTFVKCGINQAEMEPWYDHWLKVLGCAVISGPSDFGGLIPHVAAADMSPPKRRACISLTRRVSLLSDGTFVSCEQDVLGRQTLGTTLKEAWERAHEMHAQHRGARWQDYPACMNCKEWHRA